MMKKYVLSFFETGKSLKINIIFILLFVCTLHAKAQDFLFYNATNLTFTFEVMDLEDGTYDKMVVIQPGMNNLGEFMAPRTYTFKMPYNNDIWNGTIAFYRDCTLTTVYDWYVSNGKLILDDYPLSGNCPYQISLGIDPDNVPNEPIGPEISFSPSYNRNFILTSTYKSPIKSIPNELSRDEVSRQIAYVDGLGRPVQTIQWQGTPSGKDLVHYKEYDNLGRESYRYLPYAEEIGDKGMFKKDAKYNQSTYHSIDDSWDPHVKKTDDPYSVTVFENSPRNRVMAQGAPGTVWQPTAAGRTPINGRTVVNGYGTNVAAGIEAVKLWQISSAGSGASSTTNYAAGKLYKSVVKDENWTSGKVGVIEEYTDIEGRIALKRIWESESKKLETYYVYDELGNLHYVIPPAVMVSSFTEEDSVFANYIYAYRYDGRQRVVEKKSPSKGWEYIVYNLNNLPVLMQDSIQRESHTWSYTKYDAFSRVTETGFFSRNITRSALQDTLNAESTTSATALWETRVSNGSVYDNKSYPRVGATKTVLTINYYDDYGYKAANVLAASTELDSTHKVKGLLTGAKVFRDDGTNVLLSAHYYDKRGRLIQSAAQNHLGGTDYVTNAYSFVGELLTSKREHKASPAGAVTTILNTHTYDHVGRLVDTKKKVNSQPEVIQSRLSYNEIGQLKEKKVHSENDGTDFITTVTYAYNERGWITRSTSPQFSYQLKFNDGAIPQYNGNISQQLWGHGATTNSTFSYSYDKVNRLTNGTSTGTVMSEVLSYDNMGNIDTLQRDGGTAIVYSYTGNRLTSLSGGLTGSYSYDPNGNALTDRTGMTFTYNHLNLPKTATKTGTSVAYLYDAMGSKLRKTATVGSTTTQREYVGGIEYSKVATGASSIEMIHTEEGYLQRSGTSYVYHYNLKDHLGNVRATLQRTTATTGTVVQKHDYYPFGKAKALLASGINKYLYNGKEIQEELDGQYDYGARLYDAEIGRWSVVDPLAEATLPVSPYTYVGNNPIFYNDPTGMIANPYIRNNKTGEQAWVSNKTWANRFSHLEDWDIIKPSELNASNGNVMIEEVLVTAVKRQRGILPESLNIFKDLPGFYNFHAVPSGAYGPWIPDAFGVSIYGNMAGFSVGFSLAQDNQRNFGLYFTTSGGPGYTYFGDNPLKGVIGWGASFDLYDNRSNRPVLEDIAGQSYDFNGGLRLMGGYSVPIDEQTGLMASKGVHKISLGMGTGVRVTRSNTIRIW